MSKINKVSLSLSLKSHFEVCLIMIKFWEHLKTVIPEDKISTDEWFDCINEEKKLMKRILKEDNDHNYAELNNKEMQIYEEVLCCAEPKIWIEHYNSEIIESIIELPEIDDDINDRVFFGVVFQNNLPDWHDEPFIREWYLTLKYEKLTNSRNPVNLMMSYYERSLKELMPQLLRKAIGIPENKI